MTSNSSVKARENDSKNRVNRVSLSLSLSFSLPSHLSLLTRVGGLGLRVGQALLGVYNPAQDPDEIFSLGDLSHLFS